MLEHESSWRDRGCTRKSVKQSRWEGKWDTFSQGKYVSSSNWDVCFWRCLSKLISASCLSFKATLFTFDTLYEAGFGDIRSWKWWQWNVRCDIWTGKHYFRHLWVCGNYNYYKWILNSGYSMKELRRFGIVDGNGVLRRTRELEDHSVAQDGSK